MHRSATRVWRFVIRIAIAGSLSAKGSWARDMARVRGGITTSRGGTAPGAREDDQLSLSCRSSRSPQMANRPASFRRTRTQCSHRANRPTQPLQSWSRRRPRTAQDCARAPCSADMWPCVYSIRSKCRAMLRRKCNIYAPPKGGARPEGPPQRSINDDSHAIDHRAQRPPDSPQSPVRADAAQVALRASRAPCENAGKTTDITNTTRVLTIMHQSEYGGSEAHSPRQPQPRQSRTIPFTFLPD